MDRSNPGDTSLGHAAGNETTITSGQPAIHLEGDHPGSASEHEDFSHHHAFLPRSRDLERRLNQGPWVFKSDPILGGKTFRDPNAIVEYMREKEGSTTKGAIIYEEMISEMAKWSGDRPPPRANDVLEGEGRSIQVWTALFSIKYPYLLPAFHNANITDKSFNEPMTSETEDSLRSELQSANRRRQDLGLSVVDADHIINLFEDTGLTLLARKNLKKELDKAVDKQINDLTLLVSMDTGQVQGEITALIGSDFDLVETILTILKTTLDEMGTNSTMNDIAKQKLITIISNDIASTPREVESISNSINAIRNTNQLHSRMIELAKYLRKTLYLPQKISFLIELFNAFLLWARSNNGSLPAGNFTFPESDSAPTNGKWGFCPIQLRFHMRDKFRGRLILPICKMKPVFGVTSAVMLAMVPAPFICDEIKMALKSVHDQGAQEYAIVFKRTSHTSIFTTEVAWLRELQGVHGVIQYLGSFSVHSSTRYPVHYIMMEKGTMNLMEFLQEPLNRPPETFPELQNLWRAIFETFNPLQALHGQPHPSIYRIKACHADYKPANILWVNGRFVLIDFGFTTRDRGTHTGGTETYEAPEGASAEPLTPAYDIWSAGAVLLVVATWVVSGPRGVDDFAFYRRLVAEEHRRANHGIPVVSDPFHDGKRVPKALYAYMNHICNNVKRFDTLTTRIIDFVQKRLLLEVPEERATIEELLDTWKAIQSEAEEHYAGLDTLRDVDEVGKRFLDRIRSSAIMAFFWTRNDENTRHQDAEVDLEFVNEGITVTGRPASRRPSAAGQAASPSQFPFAGPMYGSVPLVSEASSDNIRMRPRSPSPLPRNSNGVSSDYSQLHSEREAQIRSDRLMPPSNHAHATSAHVTAPPPIGPHFRFPAYANDVSGISSAIEPKDEGPKSFTENGFTTKFGNQQAAQGPPNPLGILSMIYRPFQDLSTWANSWTAPLLAKTEDKATKGSFVPRKLVILYDNSSSMGQHVIPSVAAINATVDSYRDETTLHPQNQLDLYLTNPDRKLNPLLSKANIMDIKNAVLECEHESGGRKHFADMEQSIREIANNHFDQYDPRALYAPVTVICPTDGVWGSMSSMDEFRATLKGIHDCLDPVRRAMKEDLMFVVQFIRVGENPDGMERLRRLRKAKGKAAPGDEWDFNWVTIIEPPTELKRRYSIPHNSYFDRSQHDSR